MVRNSSRWRASRRRWYLLTSYDSSDVARHADGPGCIVEAVDVFDSFIEVSHDDDDDSFSEMRDDALNMIMTETSVVANPTVAAEPSAEPTLSTVPTTTPAPNFSASPEISAAPSANLPPRRRGGSGPALFGEPNDFGSTVGGADVERHRPRPLGGRRRCSPQSTRSKRCSGQARLCGRRLR